MKPEEFPFGKEAANDTDPEKEVHLNLYQFTEMMKFLTMLRLRDPSSFDEKNIGIRQQRLADANADELFGWINDGNELKWTAHPSYYHAIVAEMRRKGLMPGR